MAETRKKCSKCGETKPCSEFHKHRNLPDGLAYRCKICCREDANLYCRKVGRIKKGRKARGGLQEKLEACQEEIERLRLKIRDLQG